MPTLALPRLRSRPALLRRFRRATPPSSSLLSSGQISVRSLGMDLSPPPVCLLVVSGKSREEIDRAKSLKANPNLKLLDSRGQEIRVSLHLDEDEPSSSFQVRVYMESLATRRFGRLLIWSPRLTSTHDLLSQNFCELPVGTVCVADVQFKGRGRTTNVWESPEGCLMFSFTLDMENGHIVPLLQYVISLAMTEAIKGACRAKGYPLLDVKIKWPNDLYLNGLKVGGILCTSTYKSKKFHISAGIGLNLDNQKPTTCLNAVLQELTSAPYKLNREELLSAFFNKFENIYKIFTNQGFQVLEELYYKTWLHSGQKVLIVEKHDDQSVEVAVTILGLTSSGYLMATGDDEKKYELHPDGNSFDFFRGLVRRKLE